MCYKFSIFGLVQGVGFRPFVYSLALKHKLFGEVYNDSQGVKIFLSGNENSILDFEHELKTNLPPLARIDKIIKTKISGISYNDFKITSSKNTSKFSPILPDFAICNDCKSEFYDKNSRFFHYPFINCTNCGPRQSIIKKLPYDRANTTMSKFKMCQTCQNEYENPLNRRFHAQPISCEKCGISLILKDNQAKILDKNDFENLAKKVANLLENGAIFAIKGLGGFHLVCDAFNKNSIQKLRELKHRPKKPFAIMCKDLKMALEIAEISQKEAEILESKIKPIVILKLKSSSKIPSNLAPNLDKIGIFLAPTGLNLLIFEYFKNPIIATSANLSGEPIISNEINLYKKLGNVFDYALDNDREILNPSDDSIVQIIDKKAFYLRTSRGINPKIFLTNFKVKGTFLAIGSELKNQFVIYKNSQIFISAYIGDLKNVATFERFKKMLDLFIKSYDLKFDAVIADKHPSFLHTKYFKEKGYKIYNIQHHYAHLISNLYENFSDDLTKSNKNSDKQHLGFCFDGTGYGDNAKIWGGEVFIFNGYKYSRKYHFDEFLLLGGDKSIKEIYRLAYAIFKKYDIDTKLLNIEPKLEKKLNLIYTKEINSYYTSSLGRVFDAFYSLIFGVSKISYDAQAGMIMEKFYDKSCKESYKFEIENEKIIFKDAFLNALKESDKKVSISKFINGLVDLIIKISIKEKLDVILSGGVFQNKILVEILIAKFKENGIKYYFNQTYPTNDSGIALGQMIWFLLNKGENYV